MPSNTTKVCSNWHAKEEVIMPRRDGTGPAAAGSRTGRGLGDCQPGDNDNPSVESRFFGRRFLGRGAFNSAFNGGGSAGGRGGNRFFSNPRRFVDPAETADKGELQAEVSFLEQRLDQLKSLLKK